MSIKIEVTQEDIDSGYRCSAFLCPVARAIVRAIPWTDRVSVSKEAWVYPLGSLKKTIYHLPQKALAFISAFDLHLPVVPFSFEIEDLNTNDIG